MTIHQGFSQRIQLSFRRSRVPAGHLGSPSYPKDCHPERSAAESKDPYEQSSYELLQSNNRLFKSGAVRKGMALAMP
jgi:hypothetical protein